MIRKFVIIAFFFGALGVQPIRTEAFVFSVGSTEGILSNQSSGTPVTWRTPSALVNYAFGDPFDNAVLDAVAQWNSVDSPFEFQGRLLAGDPCSAPDDRVYARFMSDLCGIPWGPRVVGTTVLFIEHRGAEYHIIDADLFIKEDELWDVYDGPLRFPEHDFRRVILHELGHVAGLDHPDEGEQTVDAVMNSVSSEYELQPDDKNGIIALYSSPSSGPPPAKEEGGGGGGSADLFLLGGIIVYGWFSLRQRRSLAS